jgi:hypothetical protein
MTINHDICGYVIDVSYNIKTITITPNNVSIKCEPVVLLNSAGNWIYIYARYSTNNANDDFTCEG